MTGPPEILHPDQGTSPLELVSKSVKDEPCTELSEFKFEPWRRLGPTDILGCVPFGVPFNEWSPWGDPIYKYQGIILKWEARQPEYEMMIKAGDCSVKPLGRLMEFENGRPCTIGIMMELQTPFDVKEVKDSEKSWIKDEMIRLVTTLHMTHGIVHGDIKPDNFLRCNDGKLRLCDFGEAAPVGDQYEYEKHTGRDISFATEMYIAPNRNYWDRCAPATISDDLYALGLSIWAVYTRKIPFEERYSRTQPPYFNIDQFLVERRTVDIMEVDDVQVRSLIRGYLRQGGALV
jgi:hypothetical protein